jgi:C4-dicarboxylate-specific signal transduction histidine kinase
LPDVRGNRVQLQQVIVNLIKNSIEAMSTVTERARIVRIRFAIHEHGGVLVSVEDSGTGIDRGAVFNLLLPAAAHAGGNAPARG